VLGNITVTATITSRPSDQGALISSLQSLTAQLTTALSDRQSLLASTPSLTENDNSTCGLTCDVFVEDILQPGNLEGGRTAIVGDQLFLFGISIRIHFEPLHH
jgi:hypothetical protein